MIYITGDCHQIFERFNTSIFPEQKEMTKDDFVIICGDFRSILMYILSMVRNNNFKLFIINDVILKCKMQNDDKNK